MQTCKTSAAASKNRATDKLISTDTDLTQKRVVVKRSFDGPIAHDIDIATCLLAGHASR
jgi:hypothetical protein